MSAQAQAAAQPGSARQKVADGVRAAADPGTGRASSTATVKRALAAAMRSVSPSDADAVLAAPGFRAAYPRFFVRLTELSARSPADALAVAKSGEWRGAARRSGARDGVGGAWAVWQACASSLALQLSEGCGLRRAGLDAARASFVFARDGREFPLAAVSLAADRAADAPFAARELHTARVAGTAQPVPLAQLAVPYRGRTLRGKDGSALAQVHASAATAVRAGSCPDCCVQAREWVRRGIVEPSLGESLQRILACQSDLAGPAAPVFVLMGAGAEMSPVRAGRHRSRPIAGPDALVPLPCPALLRAARDPAAARRHRGVR